MTCRTCGHSDSLHAAFYGKCCHNDPFMALDPLDNEPCPCVGMDKPLPGAALEGER